MYVSQVNFHPLPKAFIKLPNSCWFQVFSDLIDYAHQWPKKWCPQIFLHNVRIVFMTELFFMTK